MHQILKTTEDSVTVRAEIPQHVWERFQDEDGDVPIADALRLYCELMNPGEMLEGVA